MLSHNLLQGCFELIFDILLLLFVVNFLLQVFLDIVVGDLSELAHFFLNSSFRLEEEPTTEWSVDSLGFWDWLNFFDGILKFLDVLLQKFDRVFEHFDLLEGCNEVSFEFEELGLG